MKSAHPLLNTGMNTLEYSRVKYKINLLSHRVVLPLCMYYKISLRFGSRLRQSTLLFRSLSSEKDD